MKKIISIILLCLVTVVVAAQEKQGYLVLTGTDGKWALKDADIENITFQMGDLQLGISEMWYVIGSDVADGSWGFTVPTSRIPLYTQDDSKGLLTYTGYFGTGEYGFKLVGEDWSRAWGTWNYGYYVKNSGDNICVPSPGYYTISLDTRNDQLNIQEAYGLTVTDYSSMALSGSFNGWGETQMQRVPGNNSHDWYCRLTLAEDSEMKFKANGSWDINWGGIDFPSGPGIQNGSNIPVLAGNYTVLFNDLTGHYRFYDPEDTAPTAYVPFTFDLTLPPADTYVDFETFDQPSVQLFGNVEIPLTVDYTVKQREVTLSYGGRSYSLASNKVTTATLMEAVQYLCGKASLEREITVTLIERVTVKGYPEVYTGTTTITCKLPKQDASQVVYFIGATDGWNKAEQKLASNGNDNIYRGFCYVADPNGWGLEFKFQKVAGDWDSQLNANDYVLQGDVTGTDNMAVTAGEGLYYMEMDLGKGTFKATKVTAMSIIGDFTSWYDDVDMVWDAERYCFTATGVSATSNGWKFRVNHDWTLNLGGTTDFLDFNGDNICIDADVIELFPTRRDNDNIYCTVK